MCKGQGIIMTPCLSYSIEMSLYQHHPVLSRVLSKFQEKEITSKFAQLQCKTSFLSEYSIVQPPIHRNQPLLNFQQQQFQQPAPKLPPSYTVHSICGMIQNRVFIIVPFSNMSGTMMQTVLMDKGSYYTRHVQALCRMCHLV